MFTKLLGFTKKQPFFTLFLPGMPCEKKSGKCRLVQFDEEFHADWEGTVMVEIRAWAESFARKLQGHFGPRLLFVGYQGSYGRGEATPESDIDIVTVLDAVAPADLDAYRTLVQAQPQGELACGFLCGKKELRAWPRYDLYGLMLDTKPVLGDLPALLPRLTEADARGALAIGAANLYHAACHTFLYSPAPEKALPGLGKAAFFCLRLWALLEDGVYRASKKELGEALAGRERALLSLSLEPESLETRKAYELLIGWCGDVLEALEREKQP